MKRLCTVGNANLDVYLVIREMPAPDSETIVDELYEGPGGAAANVAVASAKLGLKVRFLGCLGDDARASVFLDSLKREGVETSFVYRVPSGATGVVIVMVEKDTGMKRMLAFRGANEALSPDLFPEESFQEIEWMHISSIKPEKARGFLVKAKKVGCITSYDPGGAAKEGLNPHREILSMVDVLMLNEFELKSLTGFDCHEGASKLIDLGVKTVVVKLGSKGAALYEKDSYETAEAFRVKVLDTTGAGDAFNAGYIFSKMAGLNVKESLVFANAVAALKISRRGARSSPTLAEVLEFLDRTGFHCLKAKILSKW